MTDIILGPYHCPFHLWTPADGRVFGRRFAYDCETTDIDDERPSLTPSLVLATACDGQRGCFLTRETVLPFFEAHDGCEVICHNAAFDLKVTQALFPGRRDLYTLVEGRKVWDTLILKRLLSLAIVGNTARGEASLADCARVHLNVGLDKQSADDEGKQVRTHFGQYLGRPFGDIPAAYLHYATRDPLATWLLFDELHHRIKEVLANAHDVYGYVDPTWLKEVVHRFGPLAHHVQLKASIVMDALRSNGIGVEQSRREEKAKKVKEVLESSRERMRPRGYLAGEKGSNKALQSILAEIKHYHPDLPLRRTESGKQWSTAEEDLMLLSGRDPFFADFSAYKAAEKLLSTYLGKMGRQRLHPRFGYLLETGRTYCGGGFNLQNLPMEKGEANVAATVRGCFVPGEGNVFIDSDYSQIELVVLGYAMEKQLGLRSVLAQLVNSGKDVHRLIAGTLLNKPVEDVSKEERNSVKPISFGRPGGMGAERLREVAKAGYGLELTTEEVNNRIQAYHTLCPELDALLQDEVDPGRVIAEMLHLTPQRYHEAVNAYYNPHDPEGKKPQGWLGGMLLKVLRNPSPTTGLGRPYSPEEIDFFWRQAQELGPRLKLKPDLLGKLQSRQPDRLLWEMVRNGAGRRRVFTVTGRLRADTTFCSSRNTLFQGAAADGAVLALWKVWRAGYKLVDFVHDQLVVESPADDQVNLRVVDIEKLMKEGMLEVVPGMRVKVETVVTRSLNKADLHPDYHPTPEAKEGTTDVAAHAA